MRIAGPSLALSALLFAAPALAQGGGYYDSGSPYNRQQTNQDRFERYEYYPPQQGQSWQGQSGQGPTYYGPMRQGQGRWQQHHSTQPDQQWQMQSGSMQQGPQGGYPPRQMGMGQMGQSPPGPVSFSTQGQIKSSLESSGFKNVTVLPQSFLIRATAPDGSRIMMQVSSDGLYGVVVNPTDQAGSSGTAGSAGTGATTSSTGTGGATSSTGTGGTTSSTGTGGTTTGTGAGGTTSSTGTGGTSSTGDASSTGGASSSTERTTNR